MVDAQDPSTVLVVVIFNSMTLAIEIEAYRAFYLGVSTKYWDMFLFSNLKIGHCCQISAEKGDFENLENIFKTKVNTRTAAYNEIV